MQKDSVSYVCKSATCFAIGNLAESLVNHHFGSFAAIPDQMGSILVDIIPNKVSDKNDRRIAIDAFDAAKKLVEWLDYDSLPNTLRPLLEIAYKYLAKIYEKNENETFSKELVENVYSFINMTIMSAEKESPQLLQNFLPLFMKYSEKPPFRSIAARFFGDMISVGSHFLDEPFKVNVMNFALELADKENDTYSFSCIKDMILKEKEITLRFGQKICELCLAKLMIPVVKTEKFLLMRDNCIVTFVAYIMNIGTESINLDIVLPNILNALPLVIDYSENLMIADFLIWTFNLENGKFAEFILRPLIIIFANPPSIIARFQFSEQNQIEMFKILYFLLSNQSDPKQIIGSVLEDDELRANYLQSNVESMRQRYSSA
ncbi:hypothetical protein GPJ56_008590 [Histomonas meleagridis]|uniref:uncharacterized protein n=1 Tax=Histomonas meleagridis TaxID=135588 RepID=UPI00355AAAF1|nr:hypothetical protein GPJ56_008590 [Histomonas meleagridis]KAH0805833.1 hypothetical protein GO595_001472 [Histomonas meleagridis]